jgi:hypothetical protein
MTAPAAATEQRTIPFEYAFRSRALSGGTVLPHLVLTGEPNRMVHATITISIEAAFTATAIGYGVVPTRAAPVIFGPAVAASQSLKGLGFNQIVKAISTSFNENPALLGNRFGPLTEAALLNGIRINPRFATLALAGGGSGQLDPAVVGSLFETVPASPEDVQFLYGIFDQASGRAFQSDPILNTAGLGIADGDRPFRSLTPPITFRQRTTIRLDVIELTTIPALLFVSLHGYKVLGGSDSPLGRAVSPPRRRR